MELSSCDDVAHSQKLKGLFIKIICILVLPFFLMSTLSSTPAFAQLFSLSNLPAPGTLVHLSQPKQPVLLKGISFSSQDPFNFNAIMKAGEDSTDTAIIKSEALKSVKYFLAALTVPKEHAWVNLSPIEANRVIPKDFGKTLMGRDVLSLDYLLKQVTASLTHPDTDVGAQFWSTLYTIAFERYGTTELPIELINKVWIVPEKAEVVVKDNTVFVVGATLKVLTERDYALVREQSLSETDPITSSALDAVASMSVDVMQEVVIPVLEKEINTGDQFEQLRQIYHAVILATWFKRNLKKNILTRVYADQSKVSGVDHSEEAIADKIYQQYLEAYRKGAFDFIREEKVNDTVLPRHYFSGGVNLIPDDIVEKDFAILLDDLMRDDLEKLFFEDEMKPLRRRPSIEKKEHQKTASEQVKKEKTKEVLVNAGEATSEQTFGVGFEGSFSASDDKSFKDDSYFEVNVNLSTEQKKVPVIKMDGYNSLPIKTIQLDKNRQHRFVVPDQDGFIKKSPVVNAPRVDIKDISANLDVYIDHDHINYVQPFLKLVSNDFIHSFLNFRIVEVNSHYVIEATGFDVENKLVFLKEEISLEEAKLLFIVQHIAHVVDIKKSNHKLPHFISYFPGVPSPDQVDLKEAPKAPGQGGLFMDMDAWAYNELLDQTHFFQKPLGDDVARTYREIIENLGMENYAYFLWNYITDIKSYLDKLNGKEYPLSNRHALIEQSLFLAIARGDESVADIDVIGVADEGRSFFQVESSLVSWMKSKNIPIVLTYLPHMAKPYGNNKPRLTSMGVTLVWVDAIRELLKSLLADLGEKNFLELLSGKKMEYLVRLDESNTYPTFTGETRSSILALQDFIENHPHHPAVKKFRENNHDLFAVVEREYSYKDSHDLAQVNNSVLPVDPAFKDHQNYGGIDFNEDLVEDFDDAAVLIEDRLWGDSIDDPNLNIMISPDFNGFKPVIFSVTPILNLSAYFDGHTDKHQIARLK